jgi:PAS domain S-box-containing protein
MRARIVERAADGAPLRMLGAAFDVDERKRLEHELERRQRQLEAAAAAVPAWLVLTDLEQRIEFANRPVLGVPPERLVGRRVAECVDAIEAERFARHHRACVERREPTQYRSVLDGGRRVLEIRLAPVISHGTVVGVASSTTEATDRLALERAVLEIGNRERRRFGSDLHDGLGQEVTGIALTLKSLLLRAEAEGSPLVAGLREVLHHANGAIDTARRMARGVSPVAREQGGLRRALADLARPGAGGTAAVRCTVSDAVPEDLEPLVADHLYRIAQEAVTNALRHSAATCVTVALDATDAGLRLAVDDDGTGVDPAAELGPGLGLKIMRYRAEQIGGTLVIGPAAGGGTRVECRCPATV